MLESKVAISHDWLIPYVAPRRNGLITIYRPEPQAEGDEHATSYFVSLFDNLYTHHRVRFFFVPWAWTKTKELMAEHDLAIRQIADSCPTILAATAEAPYVAKRFLPLSRSGLVLGRDRHIAIVICGREPGTETWEGGWTLSLSPDPTQWTLVHPFPARVWTPENFAADLGDTH